MDEEQRVRELVAEDINKMTSDFGMDRRDLSVLMAVKEVVLLGYDGWIQAKQLRREESIREWQLRERRNDEV